MTQDERIDFLIQSATSHDRQIGELTASVAEISRAVAVLVKVTNDDATAIRQLARIADAHENRLNNL